MRKMKEINVSLSKYLLVRFLTTRQEYYLRWEQNRLRWITIMLIILLATFLDFTIGIIAISLLSFVILVDFLNDLLIALRISKKSRGYRSKGIYLDFDTKGFQRHTTDYFFWEKVFWKNVSFGIYFKKQNALMVYDKFNAEYHFFFKKLENESDFETFKKIMFLCVKKIYIC